MGKGIFNASFEESKNLVDDKYIERTLKYTNKRIMRNRFIGVFLLSGGILFFSLINLLIGDAFNYIPVDLKVLNPLWYVLSVIFPVYYSFLHFKSKKRRMINEYYCDTIFSIILFVMIVESYLLFLYGAIHINNVPFLYVLYMVYIITFIHHQVIKVRKLITKKIYTEQINEHLFMSRIEQFVSFSNKYGGLVLLFLLVYRLFFQEGSMIGDLINVIFFTVAPVFIPIIGTLFLNGMFHSAILPGYYLKKYYDEYRIEYGFTEDEWNKGMDFEEAKKKVERKLQNSSVNSIK